MTYHSNINLESPIEYLKGVGPIKGETLRKELEIGKFFDLLQHFPFRYVDKTQITSIADIHSESQLIQIKGKIVDVVIKGDKRSKRLVATLMDRTGTIELTWFKGITYFQKSLHFNKEYLVFGKPKFYGRTPSFVHPDLELTNGQPIPLSSRLMPVYHSTEKLKVKHLDSKGLAKIVSNLLEILPPDGIPEILPKKIMEEEELISRQKAFKNIHKPQDESLISQAQYRLKFEEFFCFQISLLLLKLVRKKLQGFPLKKVGDIFNNFFHDKLPFELTAAQKRVLREIHHDTISGAQMSRLLQGDVGSGKTIVALMTMLMALDNGFQAALMAPTEILAQQHLKGISKMLEGMGIQVELLTGSVKGKKRRLLLEALELGNIDILIGTHALIEDTVVFKNLGLVVIDEQHRFGVKQRSRLWHKSQGKPPHILVMTATPIPRTLAMSLYGDLDVSQIDELPPGRKAIKTVHRYENSRLKVFGFIKEEVQKGRQVYIVYPLIDESEKLDYANLMEGYESIVRAFPMPDYNVSIVHGRMKGDDKDFEMQRFVKGHTNIMVATTVIEVGVDVPNASVMIIESAERFGLSQLHQLRGRVGRGGEQSFCILMTDYKLSANGRQRIRTMTETNDGFKIAEVDLKLRGPGDIQGTAQSGLAGLKIADIIKDQDLLKRARNAAIRLLNDDPDLQKEENQPLRQYLESQKSKYPLEWSRIG